MTEWTVNNKLNDWYQKQYHIKLPKKYETKSRLYFSTAPVSSFSPIDLFATGSKGIWLDPSDLSTMFSDRAGTTPVTTPGTVVGLRLDKSKGLVLGAELVVNGTFASGTTTGWTPSSVTLSVVDDRLRVVALDNDTRFTWQSFATVVGRTYDFSFAYDSGTMSQIFYSVGTAAGASNNIAYTQKTGVATIRMFFVATATTTFINFGAWTGNSGKEAFFDNISVRELAGNHAVAPTDAARPTYGIEPKGGRRNLLTQTENYTIANNATTDSAYSGALPVGAQAARQLRETATTAQHYVRIGSPTFASPYTGQLTFTIRVLAQGRTRVQVLPERVGLGEWAGSTFDLATNTATNTITSGGQTLTGSSVADSNDGWKVIRVTYTPTTNITGLLFCLLDDVASGSTTAPSYAGDASKGVAITGMQIELGSTATNYQRVTNDYDVTEAGVQTCHYCRYDGFNTSMSTAAIDFTATDKMSVFAGVRKLSDTFSAAIELGATPTSINGAFGAYPLNGGIWGFFSRGTSTSDTQASGFTVPISSLVTGLADISGDLATLRINGTQRSQSTANQGTGNFGNYPLFLGRRNNTEFPFSGRDYGIVIVGKAASAGEITDTELWLSDKTSEVDVAKSISPFIYTRSGDTILDRANSIIERRTV